MNQISIYLYNSLTRPLSTVCSFSIDFSRENAKKRSKPYNLAYIYSTELTRQDQRIGGSEDQRIGGSEDQRIRGSEDQRIRGSEDQRIRGSEDQRIGGSEDQRIDGSEDQRIGGSEYQSIKGSEDQRIRGSEDQRIRGSEDQRIRGSQHRGTGIRGSGHTCAWGGAPPWKFVRLLLRLADHLMCIII
jgi:hypothetical protein